MFVIPSSGIFVETCSLKECTGRTGLIVKIQNVQTEPRLQMRMDTPSGTTSSVEDNPEQEPLFLCYLSSYRERPNPLPNVTVYKDTFVDAVVGVPFTNHHLQITVGLLSACLQTQHPHHHNFNNNKNRGHSQLPKENRRQSTQSRSVVCPFDTS